MGVAVRHGLDYRAQTAPLSPSSIGTLTETEGSFASLAGVPQSGVGLVNFVLANMYVHV
jgi:hypothetical protein